MATTSMASHSCTCELRQILWLQERNPAAVDALLASSEALLPAQLDRAFAAKRRARARGTAMASRTWFPSPSAWLAGAAPEADPSAAFGQEVRVIHQCICNFNHQLHCRGPSTANRHQGSGSMQSHQ